MRRTILVCAAILLLLLSTVCLGQKGDQPDALKHPFVPKEYPIEHTAPDELVSLSAGTPLAQALFILSKFSSKFESRVIIDPKRHKGNIGVDIENMHWKKAFEMVLRANGLWYVTYETYYEVVEPGVKKETKQKKGAALTPKTREVKIEAIFFEGDRQLLNELGVDWTTLRNGSLMLGAVQAGASKVSEDLIALGLAKTSSHGKVYVDALLRAIESAEKGRIIASPKIVVMVGKTARIQVGQDFTVNTRDFAGNVVSEFYSTGTIMTVTPTVFRDKNGREFIHLDIKVERSSLVDPVNVTINKTEAKSSILLYDGEDTAIAGLYSTERKRQRKGVPLLKDLPWWFFGLRYLMGYNRVEKKDQELVILLKAKLLPTLPERVASKTGEKTEFDKADEQLQSTLKSLWPRPESPEK